MSMCICMGHARTHVCVCSSKCIVKEKDTSLSRYHFEVAPVQSGSSMRPLLHPTFQLLVHLHSLVSSMSHTCAGKVRKDSTYTGLAYADVCGCNHTCTYVCTGGMVGGYVIGTI